MFNPLNILTRAGDKAGSLGTLVTPASKSCDDEVCAV